MKKIIILAVAAVVAFCACDRPTPDPDPTPVDPTAVEWGGKTYHFVELSNGQTWLKEPLAYIPEGETVCEDPTADAFVYAPYELEYNEEGTAYVGVVENTPDAVAERGYLYKLNKVFADGAPQLCPDGYHIPSYADALALCGNMPKTSDGSITAQTDVTAVLYDETLKAGSLEKFVEVFGAFESAGFVFGNKWNVTGSPKENYGTDDAPIEGAIEYVGTPGMTYYPTTQVNTGASSAQHIAMAVGFAKSYPLGKVWGLACNDTNAVTIRCIKDVEQD